VDGGQVGEAIEAHLAMAVAFYDTRNDTTGARYQTDYYLARSTDGGLTFPGADVRVSSVSSNEHDCSGLFPSYLMEEVFTTKLK
jgi:hypothetical protein